MAADQSLEKWAELRGAIGHGEEYNQTTGKCPWFAPKATSFPSLGMEEKQFSTSIMTQLPACAAKPVKS